ncbi:hypothetical protein ING2D1G_0471 [Peptoniphilus sp. ING2-D1G]|nr:hypothetical protein ING2D1G_0471 [Peptoniphilus sp. ING2-D1G]
MSKNLIKNLSRKIKLAKFARKFSISTVKLGKIAFAVSRIQKRNKSK